MKKVQVQENIRKQSLIGITLVSFFIASILVTNVGFTTVYGAEVFSKDERPFGIPYDEWIGKYWNWWISNTEEQTNPPDGSCLKHESNSMVMLLDPAVAGKHQLECDISSKDGIMVASWNGFYNEPSPGPVNRSMEAKKQVNLGAVTSDVKVDGKSVARLEETSTMSNNIFNYKINTMDNFTEVFAKPFNITIPENTFMNGQVVGTTPAGAHGWFTFLKPLPPGDHTLSYSLSVQGLGADNVASENEYKFHVK